MIGANVSPAVLCCWSDDKPRAYTGLLPSRDSRSPSHRQWVGGSDRMAAELIWPIGEPLTHGDQKLTPVEQLLQLAVASHLPSQPRLCFLQNRSRSRHLTPAGRIEEIEMLVLTSSDLNDEWLCPWTPVGEPPPYLRYRCHLCDSECPKLTRTFKFKYFPGWLTTVSPPLKA